MRIPDHCPLPPGAVVWAYLRDSGGTNQDLSIEQQRSVLTEYCNKHELVLEEVYIDEARSGTSAENRDALWRLMAHAERFPEIHDLRQREKAAARLNRGIIFWMFARLGRDQTQTNLIKASLRIRGLRLLSLSDPIITGDERIDPILEAVLGANAQLVSEQIGMEARRGLHHVVALRDNEPTFLALNPEWQPQGRYLSVFPGRVIPRGFMVEHITIGTRRNGQMRRVQRLIPDPVTWERARLAWKMRVEDRASYRKVHEVAGLYRSIGCYSTFFANRLYTGIFEYGGETYGNPADPWVEPLIPLDWFDEEQRRRARAAVRRRKGGRAQPGDPDPRITSRGRLLSGLLFCAECGAVMWADTIPGGTISTTGRQRKAWSYYQCSVAGWHNAGGECSAGKVRAERLEEAVIKQLMQDILTPENLRTYLDDFIAGLDHQRRDRAGRLDVLEKRLENSRHQAEHIADALAQRPASPTLLRKLDQTEEEVRRLEREISLTQVELAYWSRFDVANADLESLTTRVRDGLQSGDTQKARLALSMFISRIEVKPSKPLHSAILTYTFAPVQELDVVPLRRRV